VEGAGGRIEVEVAIDAYTLKGIGDSAQDRLPIQTFRARGTDLALGADHAGLAFDAAGACAAYQGDECRATGGTCNPRGPS
jgi:hypothetical protein